MQYVQNERQWLLISNKTEKVAFLSIYIACQSHKSDSFIGWNEDLFDLVAQEALQLKTQGFVILSLGDYNTRVGCITGLEKNTPDLNKNTPMFLNFLKQVNLLIINTLPISQGLFTRFMDQSGQPGTRSLLDFGLIDEDKPNSVTSFVIDENARFACGTDHALLECNLELKSKINLKWEFQEVLQYAITDSTKYDEYQLKLDSLVSMIPLHEFSNLSLDQMLPHISNTINSSALQSIGLKVKKKKKGVKLPTPIIKKLKKKSSLSSTLIHARSHPHTHDLPAIELELASLKSEIKDRISKHRMKRRHHLRTRVLAADPTRRRFWRFLKSQIKTAGAISAVYNKDGDMVFEQEEIEESVLHHFGNVFSGQTTPSELPLLTSQTLLSIDEMNDILGQRTPTFDPTHFEDKVCQPYSFNELEDTLNNLSNNKAAGFDRVPNELLRNSSFKFKQYLLEFLNKIMSSGSVPTKLNLGKCLLIGKVRFF